MRQSFGQKISHTAKNDRSFKSIRTDDYIDHDEDAESRRSYSRRNSRHSFTRQSTRSHDLTIRSRGNGVDNNDSYERERHDSDEDHGGRKLTSQGSIFSYKFGPDSPRSKRSPEG